MALPTKTAKQKERKKQTLRVLFDVLEWKIATCRSTLPRAAIDVGH